MRVLNIYSKYENMSEDLNTFMIDVYVIRIGRIFLCLHVLSTFDFKFKHQCIL